MHKNARLTPKGREVLIERLRSGQRVAEVAQEMSLSEITVRKWWQRFWQGEGLLDRSSRPHCSLRALGIGQRARIRALHRQHRIGRLIAQALGISTATVSRALRRAGLSRSCELEPAARVQRYERAVPGELIHIDAKKLGRIGEPGYRVTGRGTHCSRGIGWEFEHVVSHARWRTSLVAMAEDERQDTVVAFLEQVVARYRACGVRCSG
jgi:transposase-like protein